MRRHDNVEWRGLGFVEDGCIQRIESVGLAVLERDCYAAQLVDAFHLETKNARLAFEHYRVLFGAGRIVICESHGRRVESTCRVILCGRNVSCIGGREDDICDYFVAASAAFVFKCSSCRARTGLQAENGLACIACYSDFVTFGPQETELSCVFTSEGNLAFGTAYTDYQLVDRATVIFFCAARCQQCGSEQHMTNSFHKVMRISRYPVRLLSSYLRQS